MIRIASPCPSIAIGRSSRRHLGHDGELDRRRRHVRRPHRVAVDGAVGERRHLLGGDDVGRQHEPVGLLEVDVDRRQRRQLPITNAWASSSGVMPGTGTPMRRRAG